MQKEFRGRQRGKGRGAAMPVSAAAARWRWATLVATSRWQEGEFVIEETGERGNGENREDGKGRRGLHRPLLADGCVRRWAVAIAGLLLSSARERREREKVREREREWVCCCCLCEIGSERGEGRRRPLLADGCDDVRLWWWSCCRCRGERRERDRRGGGGLKLYVRREGEIGRDPGRGGPAAAGLHDQGVDNGGGGSAEGRWRATMRERERNVRIW